MRRVRPAATTGRAERGRETGGRGPGRGQASRAIAAAAALAIAFVAVPARAQQGDSLGRVRSLDDLDSYERDALADVLDRRGFEIEPEPEGKVVDHIYVENLDVFDESNGFLTWFNLFHFTSRRHVVRREVVVEPGTVWDESKVQETRRRIYQPLFTSFVVVAPIKNGDPNKVDLLVVTRDIWSLRLNSNYEIQESQLTLLTLSLSENNLFGYRKQVAFVFDMDQGQYDLGPQYIDPNIAGTRLQLSTLFRTKWSRADSTFEGTESFTSFGYPLWSLSSKWAAGVTVAHFDSRVRFFRGTDLAGYDNPDTEEIEGLPWTYERRILTVRSPITRQLGESVRHRISTGHDFQVRRTSFTDDFPSDDPVDRDAFARDVFPRSERSSSLFVGYSFFIPDYVVYRDLDTYDLPEDARLGPAIDAEVSVALKPLGSERNFTNLSLGAAYLFDWANDGYVRLSAGASARRQVDGNFVDNLYSGTFAASTPRIGNLFRVLGRANVARRIDDFSNGFLALGGDSGLRGYAINAFTGQARILTNLELRSMPSRVWFSRVGGLLFWDMGHVADRLCFVDRGDGAGCVRPFHDVGIGLRSLIPQLQPAVFRFDWAIPLQADPSSGASAGFPGRFTAGAAQVF